MTRNIDLDVVKPWPNQSATDARRRSSDTQAVRTTRDKMYTFAAVTAVVYLFIVVPCVIGWIAWRLITG